MVGQYADLATDRNGFIEQSLTLPEEKNYILAFDQQSFTNNFASHQAEVWWNGQIVKTCNPTIVNVTREWVIISGINGTNILKFV